MDLFDLSIRDNLCLGKKIPEEKIMQLLDEAGLMNWYKELPNGLETMVGEKGIKLSAGQKQRVSIARAIVKDPDIILADEPTGNVDEKTSEQVLEILKEISNERLVVIISHNLDEAQKFADRIIEMSDGKIISDKSINPTSTDKLIIKKRFKV